MQALMLAAPRRVEFRDVPTPVIDAPSQALVRPLAVAVPSPSST